MSLAESEAWSGRCMYVRGAGLLGCACFEEAIFTDEALYDEEMVGGGLSCLGFMGYTTDAASYFFATGSIARRTGL